jgi:hypothetical protein
MRVSRTVEVLRMADEHDDDLEPEVIEGAEIETEEYEGEEEDNAPETHVADSAGRAEDRDDSPDAEEEEGDPSDSM